MGVLIVSPDALLARLIEVDTWTLVFWRGLFLSIGIIGVIAVVSRESISENFRRIGSPGLVLAVLNAIGVVSFIYAIDHTTVANTLLILSTTPLFAALASWLLMREPLPLRTWFAILLVMLGIAVISSAAPGGTTSLKGDFAALIGSFALGTCFSMARRFADRSVLPSICIGALIIVVVMLPISDPLSITMMDLLYLVLMGLVLLPVGMACMFYGPRYVPAAEIGLLMLLESVLGPLWVWLVLAETPTTRTFIGGGIILCALIMNLMLSLRRRPSIVKT
ncbi:MAG: drug/metabolite transporter (DMT)-like permease [Parasphingorhabdus sp.]